MVRGDLHGLFAFISHCTQHARRVSPRTPLGLTDTLFAIPTSCGGVLTDATIVFLGSGSYPRESDAPCAQAVRASAGDRTFLRVERRGSQWRPHVRYHSHLHVFGCVTPQRDDAEEPCRKVEVCHRWRRERWEDRGDCGFPIGFHTHRRGTRCGCPLGSLGSTDTGTGGRFPLRSPLTIRISMRHRSRSLHGNGP
jgi:hypothetical protein